MFRKIFYVLLTISFIMLVSGGVALFLLDLKKDKEVTYRQIQDVADEFEVFSNNTSAFESFRDDLYTNVLSEVYYDTMYSEDKSVKNKLSNYEQLVDELTKNTNKMNKLCENVYYPDSVANSRCSNYKSIYEQVVNYFVYDISLYNKNVQNYNNYQKKNASTLVIEEYKTKKKYIDYNNDKKYDGKEE